jgi:hypothetical protein
MMYAIAIGGAVIVLMTVYNYIKSVAAHEAMLVALRRENTQLLHDKLSLERRNMQLMDERDALAQQLKKDRAIRSIRDNNNADLIAALQAECRRKDKIIAQKWQTAKAAHAAMQR